MALPIILAITLPSYAESSSTNQQKHKYHRTERKVSKKPKSCERYTSAKVASFKIGQKDYGCTITTEADCTCFLSKTTGANYPEVMEFPETLTYQGNVYTITTISSFQSCKGIKEVIFPRTVKKIADNCFRSVDITKITWGGSEEKLYDAFQNAKMDVVKLPKSLKYVRLYYSFQYCPVLIIPKEIEEVNGMIYSNVNKKIFFYAQKWTSPVAGSNGASKTTIYYFRNEVLLGSNQNINDPYEIFTLTTYESPMALKKEVQKVLTNDFRFYESSTGGIALAETFKEKDMSFEIPSSLAEVPGKTVDELGPELLKDWPDLMDITIPATIKTINSSVFSGCTNLLSITFESQSVITTIMSEAFRGTQLADFTFEDSVRNIGSKIFMSCQVQSISLPATMLSIAADAFDGCDTIDTFTIRNTDTTINSFSGCTSLRGKLVISNGITKIDKSCFSKTSIETLELPETLTSIAMASFYQCNSLAGILKLPSCVNDIQANAFASCPSITEVHYCGTNVITKTAFGASPTITEIYVSKDYASDTFCNINVVKSLNAKCEIDPEIVPSKPSEESSPSKPSEESSPSKPSEESSPSKPSEESSPSKPSEESSPSKPSEESSPSKPSNPSGTDEGDGDKDESSNEENNGSSSENNNNILNIDSNIITIGVVVAVVVVVIAIIVVVVFIIMKKKKKDRNDVSDDSNSSSGTKKENVLFKAEANIDKKTVSCINIECRIA